MGKYDKYKKLVLAANLIKSTVTRSLPGSHGQLTTAGPGNEGVEMVEWINERIDDGSITAISFPSTTNLSYSNTINTVTVISDTGTDAILPAASTTLAGVMTASDKTSLNAIRTLTGMPVGSLNLGTFTGNIIPDNVTIKAALQSLETELDSFPTIISGDLTSLNTQITITNGNGAVINGGASLELNPSNILLETLGGLLDLNQLNSSGALNGDFLVFNGTNFEPFTYTPITPDHNDLNNIQGGVVDEYYHLDQEVYDSIYNLSAGELLGQASYLGAPQVQAITLDDSIVMNLTTGKITLVNDTAAPGNSMYYGTNGSGVKGWHSSLFTGVTSVSVTDSIDIDFTITDPTTTPNITGILTNTTVTAGTYGAALSIPTFTVDTKGRITGAGNIPLSLTSTNISDFNEAVDDSVSNLLVAGTNISLIYDDLLNTLTINSVGSGTVDGTGIADTVAFWSDTNTLGANLNFKFDGDYVTMGDPTSTSISILTTKGTGATLSTYGYVHQNSGDTEVFKVADNGAITIGALQDVYIHPDQMNISAGGLYVISKSGGDLGLYSDTTVVVESGDVDTNTPSFKSIATRSTSIGPVYNAQIEGTFTTTGTSNRYTDLHVKTVVNQVGGTSPIRSIYIEPTIVSAANYAGLEINVPGGHTALRTIAGKVGFNLGSDATGDILYRDANGNLARLAIGASDQVLGSTGTIPSWTTTAGSLPGGMEGDFLIYAGGNWTAASPIIDKQTGITGTNVTLGATPVALTLFQLFRNGVLQDEGLDFTRMGTTITILSGALIPSDKITAIYYN